MRLSAGRFHVRPSCRLSACATMSVRCDADDAVRQRTGSLPCEDTARCSARDAVPAGSPPGRNEISVSRNPPCLRPRLCRLNLCAGEPGSFQDRATARIFRRHFSEAQMNDSTACVLCSMTVQKPRFLQESRRRPQRTPVLLFS